MCLGQELLCRQLRRRGAEVLFFFFSSSLIFLNARFFEALRRFPDARVDVCAGGKGRSLSVP